MRVSNKHTSPAAKEVAGSEGFVRMHAGGVVCERSAAEANGTWEKSETWHKEACGDRYINKCYPHEEWVKGTRLSSGVTMYVVRTPGKEKHDTKKRGGVFTDPADERQQEVWLNAV